MVSHDTTDRALWRWQMEPGKMAPRQSGDVYKTGDFCVLDVMEYDKFYIHTDQNIFWHSHPPCWISCVVLAVGDCWPTWIQPLHKVRAVTFHIEVWTIWLSPFCPDAFNTKPANGGCTDAAMLCLRAIGDAIAAPSPALIPWGHSLRYTIA